MPVALNPPGFPCARVLVMRASPRKCMPCGRRIHGLSKTPSWKLRRGRDSNPRDAYHVCSLSKRVPSTARPPLPKFWSPKFGGPICLKSATCFALRAPAARVPILVPKIWGPHLFEKRYVLRTPRPRCAGPHFGPQNFCRFAGSWGRAGVLEARRPAPLRARPHRVAAQGPGEPRIPQAGWRGRRGSPARIRNRTR